MNAGYFDTTYEPVGIDFTEVEEEGTRKLQVTFGVGLLLRTMVGDKHIPIPGPNGEAVLVEVGRVHFKLDKDSAEAVGKEMVERAAKLPALVPTASIDELRQAGLTI